MAEISGSYAKGVVFLSGEFWDCRNSVWNRVLVLFLRMGSIFRSHGEMAFVDGFEIWFFTIFFVFWYFVLFLLRYLRSSHGEEGLTRFGVIEYSNMDNAVSSS